MCADIASAKCLGGVDRNKRRLRNITLWGILSFGQKMYIAKGKVYYSSQHLHLNDCTWQTPDNLWLDRIGL